MSCTVNASMGVQFPSITPYFLRKWLTNFNLVIYFIMKQEILKLNSNFYPVGVSNWKSAFVDIVSGAAFPLDVTYDTDENGKIDKNKISSFQVIKTFKEWENLEIRDIDDYVNTSKKSFRLPPIIVCAKFNRILFKHAVFPTKTNIWKRDNYTCQYTGKKLTKEELSIDHILPSSRGGENTWENLVTCDRNLNVWKSDRTPKECGLKLLKKPTKPTNGMIFSFMRKEWEMFVDGGTHE